jgi:hypothetical protein
MASETMVASGGQTPGGCRVSKVVGGHKSRLEEVIEPFLVEVMRSWARHSARESAGNQRRSVRQKE